MPACKPLWHPSLCQARLLSTAAVGAAPLVLQPVSARYILTFTAFLLLLALPVRPAALPCGSCRQAEQGATTLLPPALRMPSGEPAGSGLPWPHPGGCPAIL